MVENWEQSYLTALTYLDDRIPIKNKFLYQLGLKTSSVS